MWFSRSSHGHQQLNHDDSKESLISSESNSSIEWANESLSTPLSRGREGRVARWIHWTLHITLIGAVLFLATAYHRLRQGAEQQCFENNNYYSPIYEGVKKTLSTKTFNGTFDGPSPFKGPPSAETEEAWGSIINTQYIPLTEAQLVSLGGDPATSVKFPTELADGYLGLYETAHYLHCLKALWEDHHMAASPGSQRFKASMPLIYEAHFEHCVDMLRQRLMCTADASLITFNWVRGAAGPYPNFNTRHQCANYDEMWAYVRSRQVRIEDGWAWQRPADAQVLQHAP